MKFSELSADDWGNLQLYLDTALVPVTGLTGAEAPHEMTEKLERLRELMEAVERPFQGRIVTMPVVQYVDEHTPELIAQIARNLREQGFKFVVLVAGECLHPELNDGVDLIVRAGLDASSEVRKLWSSSKL